MIWIDGGNNPPCGSLAFASGKRGQPVIQATKAKAASAQKPKAKHPMKHHKEGNNPASFGGFCFVLLLLWRCYKTLFLSLLYSIQHFQANPWYFVG